MTITPSPWARAQLDSAAGQPVPAYGSPEFDALPPGSPLRAASAVAAAEAYRVLTDPAAVEARLREEVRLARLQYLADEAAGWADAAAQLPSPGSRPTPRFRRARRMRQTDDWPPVRMPGRLPSTAAMIRAVA